MVVLFSAHVTRLSADFADFVSRHALCTSKENVTCVTDAVFGAAIRCVPTSLTRTCNLR